MVEQVALVHINTLMLQDVLANDERDALWTGSDRRGLTSLFWQRDLPCGHVRLDMSRPFDLTRPVTAGRHV